METLWAFVGSLIGSGATIGVTITVIAWKWGRWVGNVERRQCDKDTHCKEQQDTCHRRFSKLETIVDRLRNGRATP